VGSVAAEEAVVLVPAAVEEWAAEHAAVVAGSAVAAVDSAAVRGKVPSAGAVDEKWEVAGAHDLNSAAGGDGLNSVAEAHDLNSAGAVSIAAGRTSAVVE